MFLNRSMAGRYNESRMIESLGTADMPTFLFN